MKIIPAKLEFIDSKHMNDWNRAKAFVEKYGEKFTSEANEICRNIGIETMRMYQRELSQKLLPDSVVPHSSKEERTFPNLKVMQFQKLLSGLNQLCAESQREPLAPRDFVKECDLGPNPTEDEMKQFWDDLWERLPEKWRSEDFKWHHIYFSDTELPFFVWICRPPTRQRRSFGVRMTKEEYARFKEKSQVKDS